MGKATISIPLVTLRPDGLGGFRPRYVASARHRRLGFKGEDLRHPDGRWFSLDECAAWSAARLAEIADLAAATPRERRAALRAALGPTVGELFDAWFKTQRMKGEAVVEGRKERRPLAATTVEYYKAGRERIRELDDGLIWNSPAAAVTARILGDEARGVLHRIEVARGLHVARCVRATGSACWAWAKGAKLVAHNPWKDLDYTLPVPAARVRYGSIAEMQHLVRAADLLETRHAQTGEIVRTYRDVGDAIVLGLWSGQRQADRLALVDGQETADGIVFQQRKKHGQPLLIPNAPELRTRLAALRARRAGWKINYPNVLLNEEARAPWSPWWYRHCFARVRDAAVKGIHPDGTLGLGKHDKGPWRLEPMPSLADFHDQDLRDTAVTWLALAGCTKPEIAAITGHSLGTIDEILKHYLGLHPDLARSAIGKLTAWWDHQQGETNG